MISLLYRAHILAQLHPKRFLVSVFAAIFFGGLFVRNPLLAVTLALSVVLILSCLFVAGKPLRLTANTAAGVALASVTLAMLLSPDTAHAAGLGAWARQIKAQLGDIYDLIIYGSYGVGIAGVATGINNAKKKSDGDSQIKTSSIFGNSLGGVVLMMLGYFADSAAESVGGSSGQMNRMPGGVQ